MMNKQALAALIAAILGLILVLALTLVFNIKANSVWRLIAVSLFASGLSAFLSCWLSGFLDRIKHGWNFGSARDAHRKLASLLPRNNKFNEIIITAYTANSAYRMLELFDERNCFVERLRILLRNPVALVSGEGKEGAIPSDKAQINNRISQMSAHLLGDILRRRLGMERVHKLEIRFYNNEPVLRGMVIDGKKGFFSIFTKRRDTKAIDYSATNSATLRLSADGGYEGKILKDFMNWFNLVWEHGSETFDEKTIENIL